MNFFKGRSKTFTISECDPTFKVKYLGNVLTTFVKGDGCVDRPLSVLWNNYLANPSVPKEMQLTVTNSGLKAITKDQGLMEYRCHRIAYCLHHPQYPKLFVWVYRHEGKKMKVEARCHAILCKSEAKAKAIHAQLKDRMAFALSEFMREKTRRQNSRLILQRTLSVPCVTVGTSLPLRTRLLRVGQHFKPPSSLSSGAPSLDAINEELGETELGSGGSRLTRWSGRGWSAAGAASAGAASAGVDDIIEEEEDDSVFELNSPVSIDCRLTDIIPSFFVNGGIAQTNSTLGSTEVTSRHQSSMDSIKDNTLFTASSLPSINIEDGSRDLGSSGDLFDTEIMVNFRSSISLDCDDQSIESGFSEQDAHDL